jgi:hypothetical protein
MGETRCIVNFSRWSVCSSGYERKLISEHHSTAGHNDPKREVSSGVVGDPTRHAASDECRFPS